MTISFTTVNTKLQQLKEDDSDLSDSEEEDESSHFHIYDNSGFQLSQLNEEFEPHISNLFNHSSGRMYQSLKLEGQISKVGWTLRDK